jgi:tRNA 2-thiouridine synthesizing protein A
VIDASGLKCPLPVLLARRALKTHPAITLITTDPASVIDIPVFCAEAGHTLAGQEETEGRWMFTIAWDRVE